MSAVLRGWVAYYNSNRKRHIKTFATRREAAAFQNKTAVDMAGGRHIAPSAPLTIAQAAGI
jgi:hypothetical protein